MQFGFHAVLQFMHNAPVVQKPLMSALEDREELDGSEAGGIEVRDEELDVEVDISRYSSSSDNLIRHFRPARRRTSRPGT